MTIRDRRSLRGPGASASAWPLVLLVVLGSLVGVPSVRAAYTNGDDLPGPPAHLETVPAGSLVIPMDNTLQAITPPFNLKAYGLVHDLLVNGIPVKWAIKAGKAKDGIDFTATAQRIAPTAIGAASLNFAGGPVIVHRDFAVAARARITAFANNVAVYELTADATVDVRYDLTHRPRIAVSNVNTAIHTDILAAAGIGAAYYTVLDPVNLNATTCFTSHSEPHTSATAGIPNVKAFVQAGGNFMAQCLASKTYENNASGLFQTTLGTTNNNLNNSLSYPNPDLAFSQFVGILNPAPGGSEQDWRFAVGSAWQNGGHVHADNVGASPAHWAATASKHFAGGPGGNVYYLGGHDYGGSTALEDVNGRRMYLNFVLVPSTRPAACNLDNLPFLRTLSGAVYEDVNGDSSLADASGRPGVRVRLYRDANDNGLADAADAFVAEATTGPSGAYSFNVSTASTGTKYLVAVDSKGITPSAGLNGGFTQGDVWAEQTYGDDPATPALDVAARYGGRTPATSDNFAASTLPASNGYQHLARADATAGNVTGLDFAFSFQVLTHTRGGDAADDDPGANRTIQGSLRQFLRNANAISGPNVLRFVPAVATNAAGGGGAWWRIDVTVALSALTDSGTTVDGRAYSSANGTTVRDDNAGSLGTGGTVGVDALALATLARPELEIRNLRSTAVVNVGLDAQGASCAFRRLAVSGFGALANSDLDADVRAGAGAHATVVEECLLGAPPSSFADPGAAIRSVGDHFRAVGGDGGTLRNNLIGYGQGKGVALASGSNNWLVEGNELRGNAIGNGDLDGIDLESGTTGATVRGNLVAQSAGCGVDSRLGGGSNTLVNNTIQGNGAGAAAAETAGVRLHGSGSVVDRNVVSGNVGAGVLATSGSAQNRITRNSIFGNGPSSGQIGIDLTAAGDDQGRGSAPFFTVNDAGDGDAGANTLLNYPVISSAIAGGGTLSVAGYSRPGTTIEFFVAEADPSGFGEGKTFLFSAVEGSPQDANPGNGTYGPAAVNGLVQGTDTTSRFAFSVPLPGGVGPGTSLTATATDPSNHTSEFSGNATVVVNGVVKRTFREDGTPLANGTVVPKGTLIQFLLYVNNPGGPVTDVSLEDALDPAFGYVAGSMRFTSSPLACAELACTAAEEAAILAAASIGSLGTEGTGDDAVSRTGATIRAGNQVDANARLDLPGAKVWALRFVVRVQ